MKSSEDINSTNHYKKPVSSTKPPPTTDKKPVNAYEDE